MGNLKTIVAGNWKMNLTVNEGLSLMEKIDSASVTKKSKCQIIIAPSYLSIYPLKKFLEKKNSLIKIATQDIYYKDQGAYTSKVSVPMIKDLDLSYSLIGHSETREYFNETDETINLKMLKLLKAGISPILCIGETLLQRENNQLEKVLKIQIEKAFKQVFLEEAKKVIIAYEPIWAIGTGKSASSEEAEEAHQLIRRILNELYDLTTAKSIPLLYGGSVKVKNAHELFSKENINGGLIGGASLKEEFLDIIRIGNEF